MGLNHDVTVAERIEELVAEHGTLRAAARHLGTDVGYLSRLSRNEKDNPSDSLLAALGLVRVTTFHRISREGSLPEGRASAGPSAEGIEPGAACGTRPEKSSEREAPSVQAGGEQLQRWLIEFAQTRGYTADGAMKELGRKYLDGRFHDPAIEGARQGWLDLFEGKWTGAIGQAKSWGMAGPYRHALQRMRGETLRAAIDAELDRTEGPKT